MKLIWTYDGNVGKTHYTQDKRITIINYYILSIYNAKKFGYHTIIYVTPESKHYFNNVADEVLLLENELYQKVWDYPKIYVLENRDDDYILIDGDVILNKRLPEFKCDIMFDTYEEDDMWNFEYVELIQQLNNMGISNIVNFWEDKKIAVMNTGILHIKNNDFKKNYVKLWKEMYNWIFSQSESVDSNKIAIVISQFFLTLLANNKNMVVKNINNYVGENSEYYKHYFNNHKFFNNLVPNNKILKLKKSIF